MSVISDIWSVLRAFIESTFDTLKVLYTALSFLIQPATMASFTTWMPSLVVSVMGISLVIIVLLRVVGR